jgi:integrase
VHLRSDTIRSFAEKHFREALGPLPLREVTAARIEGLLNSKRGELSPESLNHLRALAHRLFTLAIRRGFWSAANPVAPVQRFKVPRRLPEYLRAEEVPLVLAALDDRWRPLFACALWTGLRRGELLALRKQDVDLSAGTLAVSRSHDADTTKGGVTELAG